MSELLTFDWNFSKDDDFHSQRNNRLIPLGSCGVTSDVMAMKQAGWPVDAPSGVQPEDMLSGFLLNSKFSQEAQQRFAAWSMGIPLNQVHVLMVWAMNRIFGGEEWSIDGPVAVFRTGVTVVDLFGFLSRGYGIVLSGVFELSGGRELNHIVSMAGFGFKSGLSDIPASVLLQDATLKSILQQCPYVIIDDPYGNYHTGYRDHRGNDVKVPMDDFLTIFKPTFRSDAKWAQLIYPYGGA